MPALALLLALSGAEGAAQEPERRELVANLQWCLGRAVDAEFQPLDLDLQSATTKDLDVDILIEDEVSRARVSRRETVPAGGRRRLILHLPTGRLGGMSPALRPSLRVSDLRGRELATFPLSSPQRSWSREEILVGVVSASGAPDAAFGLGWKVAGANVEVARLSADRLPDRWYGLAPLRLLFLHDPPLDVLSPEQAAALRDYVRQGGTLLVSGSALAHPAIAAIAEIRAGEPVSRDSLPALEKRFGAWPASAPFRFTPVANGEAYPRLEGAGVTRFSAGYGQVIALSFDVLHAPFKQWAGLAALMNELVSAAPRADLEWMSGAGMPPEFGQSGRRRDLLSRMRSLINPYPSYLLLAGLTLLYLAMVGPLNYLVLRRLRMTLLLVVTVPALSLVFLSLTLGLAYLIKGGTVTVCSLRLMSTRPGLGVARETRLAALFSPSTRDYDVSTPDGHAALPVDRSFSYDERHLTAAPLEISETPPASFKGVSIGQWQSWALESRAIVDVGEGLRWESKNGRVRVRNGTRFPIERALWVRRGAAPSAVPLGPIAPGAEAEAELTERWTPLEDLRLDPDSLGGRVLGPTFETWKPRRIGRAISPREDEILICVAKDDGPGLRVNTPVSTTSLSFSLLLAWKDKP